MTLRLPDRLRPDLATSNANLQGGAPKYQNVRQLVDQERFEAARQLDEDPITAWLIRHIGDYGFRTAAAYLNNPTHQGQPGHATTDTAHRRHTRREAILVAVCRITPRPTSKRPSLKPVARSLRKLLNQHQTGATPQQLLEAIKPWQHLTQHWPQLDQTTFAVANWPITNSPDGVVVPSLPMAHPRSRRRLKVHQYLTSALEQMAEPQNPAHIMEVAQQMADEGHANLRIRLRETKDILNMGPNFRWTGRSRYGLAKWNVGLSDPQIKAGRRIGITDEIRHLIRKQGPGPGGSDAV